MISHCADEVQLWDTPSPLHSRIEAGNAEGAVEICARYLRNVHTVCGLLSGVTSNTFPLGAKIIFDVPVCELFGIAAKEAVEDWSAISDGR